MRPPRKPAGSQFVSKSNTAWYDIELHIVICIEEPEWATNLSRVQQWKKPLASIKKEYRIGEAM